MATRTLFAYQGCDLETNIQLVADDGTYINVANYTFNGVVRQNPFSNYPTADLLVSAYDAPNGNTSVVLSAANTANILTGSYIYTVTGTTNNITTLLLQGSLIVLPSAGVTQPLPPNTYPQILNDEFYALAGQNSFYLSFAPANTSNVTIIYNGVVQANSNTIYTLTGDILVFVNSANQGDLIQATTTIPVNVV
jgi:hypothetical protein